MRRIGAVIEERLARALEQSASENERTLAAEIRLAIKHYLRDQGRVAD